MRSDPARSSALPFFGAFLVLAATALAGSFWLRAGPMETGLAALERGDESVVAALLDSAGNGSLPAGRVGPLVNLALATGATDRAVALLEAFVRNQPDHAGALRRLADVLDQARQNARLAEVLERVHAATGEVEHLRRASELHDALGQRADRIRTLGQLIHLEEAEPEETLIFAQSMAASGDHNAAFQAILRAVQRGPGDFAGELLSLGAVLALDLPQPLLRLSALGEAGAAATAGLAQAAQALLDRDQAPAARALLSRLPQAQLDQPVLLATSLQAELRTDRALAWQRMGRLRAAGLLPLALAPELVLLQAEAGDLEAALQLAAALPPEAIPETLPPWLLERLAGSGRLALLGSLPLGGLAESPFFAAMAALERGALREAVPLARRAAEQPPETPGQQALMAQMLRRLDLARPVFAAILDGLRRGEASPARLALLPLLAEGQAAAALAALRPWRDRLPGAGVPWAILAAQQGQTREVLAWLPGATLPLPALLEIQAAALIRRDQPLAEAAGQAALRVARADQGLPAGWTEAELGLRAALAGPLTEALVLRALDEMTDAPPARMERIIQLLAAHPELAGAARFTGRVFAHPALARLPASASSTFLLAVLAPERALDLAQRAQAEPLRFGPLQVAARFRMAGEAEGIAALRDMLSRLPAESREAATHVAISLAPASAAAIERTAAEALGGGWAFNVLARLERGGQRGPLLAALRTRAGDASLPRTERLAAASRLSELQDREGATAALRGLAEGLAPDSSEVRQLVYLWGPASRPEALTWAERRARAAPSGQRAAWLAHLDYLGGNAQALRLLGEWRDGLATDLELARVAAALFYRAGPRAGAEPLLAAAIPQARDAAILGALGQAADAAALPRLALQAYSRALALRPNEREWRLAAARAAASAHRPEEAAQHYRQVIADGRPTPAIMLEAGDALRGVREPAAARRLYTEALAQTQDDRLRARLLARLGRRGEAEALLNRLLAAAPNDPELRAELLDLRAL